MDLNEIVSVKQLQPVCNNNNTNNYNNSKY